MTLRALHALMFLTALAAIASAQEPSLPVALSSASSGEETRAPTSLSNWLRAVGETVRVPDEHAWQGDRTETVLEAVRRELTLAHRASQGQVLVQINLLPLIEGAIRRLNDARRRYAVAEAKRRVARELAEFCLARECAPIAPEPSSSSASPPEGVFLPAAVETSVR